MVVGKIVDTIVTYRIGMFRGIGCKKDKGDEESSQGLYGKRYLVHPVFGWWPSKKKKIAWYDCPISTGKVEGINNKIKVIKRVPYGFRGERCFQLRLYALRDCRIIPNVGWTWIFPPLSPRAYARASGGFRFYPSPLHPYAANGCGTARKGWRFFVFMFTVVVDGFTAVIRWSLLRMKSGVSC